MISYRSLGLEIMFSGNSGEVFLKVATFFILKIV